MKYRLILQFISALVLILLVSFASPAQTTEFTYQGYLHDNSQPANGNYDFEFALFDALLSGNQIGSTLTRTGVTVSEGKFTVRLDFGSEFPGAGRYLEIRVQQSASSVNKDLIPAFTTLSPRQPVTSAPYAVKSLNATTATTATTADHATTADNATNADNATTASNALQLGGVAANQFVLTTDSRMTDARTPTTGSADYIQNTTTQQTSSNFSVSGTGKAAIFDAATQFNIGGNRVLSDGGVANLFAGFDAGKSNTTGQENSFFGWSAGSFNTEGRYNSFFGRRAGFSNTEGGYNSFFGNDAGYSNITGIGNSFVGSGAGQYTTTGGANSFFGHAAGLHNTTGTGNSFFGNDAGWSSIDSFSNSFFGSRAGRLNSSGNYNSFFGSAAGADNTTGGANSFFGDSAGDSNTTGSYNTVIGGRANVGASNLMYATAIGGGAVVSTSNTIQLGRTNGSDAVLVPGSLTVSGIINATLPSGSNSYIQNTNTQQASSNFNVSGTGKAAIFDASTQFNLGGSRVLSVAGTDNTFAGTRAGETNTGAVNSFFGATAGSNNTTGSFNSFFGASAGSSNVAGNRNSIFGTSAGRNTSGDSNSFFGTGAGFSNTTGNLNTVLGFEADVGMNNLTNATAFGANAQVSQSNSLVLGSINGVNGATANTNVGIGTVAPSERLHVVGNGLITGDLNTGGLTVNGSFIGSVGAGSITGILGVANGGTGLNSVGLDGRFMRSNGTNWIISRLLSTDIVGGSGSYIQNQVGIQSANFRISGTGTANIFDAEAQYNIGGSTVISVAGIDNIFAGRGAGLSNTTGYANSFTGKDAGKANTEGSHNSFFGWSAGVLNTTGIHNTFIGLNAGDRNTTGSDNTVIGVSADVGVENLNFATAVGAGAVASFSNTIQLGRSGSDSVRIGKLGSAGSTSLCQNSSRVISTCSSSIRYKSNIEDFRPGLTLIRKLRPVSFDWKDGGMLDVGLVAEEVEKVEPLLTTKNSKAEIEGVKYDRLGVVLVNAVKEQQAQIERQQKIIERQQKQIDALKTVVCAGNKTAEICRTDTENREQNGRAGLVVTAISQRHLHRDKE